MSTTHALTNFHGNVWYFTTPQGQVVDAVVAPYYYGAALAVQHLLLRDGVWEEHGDGRYTYRAKGRNGVFRRARHH